MYYIIKNKNVAQTIRKYMVSDVPVRFRRKLGDSLEQYHCLYHVYWVARWIGKAQTEMMLEKGGFDRFRMMEYLMHIKREVEALKPCLYMVARELDELLSWLESDIARLRRGEMEEHDVNLEFYANWIDQLIVKHENAVEQEEY